MKKNTELQNYLNFIDIVKQHGGDTSNPNVDVVKALIEDMVDDIAISGKVITARLADIVSAEFSVNTKSAMRILNSYASKLSADILESLDVDFYIEEASGGRMPKLSAKEKDMRSKAAQVTKKLYADSEYKAAANKLAKIARAKIKKLASDAGIPPAKINVKTLKIKL